MPKQQLVGLVWCVGLAVVCAVGVQARGGDAAQAEIKMLRSTLEKERTANGPLREQIAAQKKAQDELDRELTTLKAAIAAKDKQIEALTADLAMARKELEKLTEEKTKGFGEVLKERNKDRTKPLQLMPVQGDEGSLALLNADPRKFFGKDVVLCGGLTVDSYYNFGFSDEADRWYSFKLAVVDKDMNRLGAISLYSPKEYARDLVTEVAKANDMGRARAVRVKITVTDQCLREGGWVDVAVLKDWQFLNEDRSGWLDWAKGGENRRMPSK